MLSEISQRKTSIAWPHLHMEGRLTELEHRATGATQAEAQRERGLTTSRGTQGHYEG